MKKKFITFLVVGGMVANIGLAANAYSKKSTTASAVKTSQYQRVATTGSAITTTGSAVTIAGQTRELTLKTKLDALVKAGTITQLQADKVMADYKAKEAARIAEMDKVSKMTEAERKIYFDSKVKTEKIDILANLVKTGIITQAQSNATKKLLPRHGAGHRMDHGVNR